MLQWSAARRQGSRALSFRFASHSLLTILYLLLPIAHSFLSPPFEILSPDPTLQSTSTTRLHGIKGFRTFFPDAFPSAVRSITSTQDHHVDCDHLLIDVNQFLHTAMRRSRTEKMTHTNLMKILDDIVRLTRPRKSIVLAMDGPPPVAKLATQRKRRQGTLDRGEAQFKLLKRLSKSKNRKIAKQAKRLLVTKKKKWANELAALAITPGTSYMDRAASAILFWVWQRLQRRMGPLHGLQIYVSSSNVPGEGEIKLIEWLNNHDIDNKDEVVLIGGDSDLVLEGLMVHPTHRTPNVHVLMPVVSNSYVAVKIANVVEDLSRVYGLTVDKEYEIMLRTDVVLLLILTGNDYLPKLRGNVGFGHSLQIYASLKHQWQQNKRRTEESFIMDAETMQFNQEFAVQFFQRISETSSGSDGSSSDMGRRSLMTPLGRLFNLRDAGLFQSVKFEITKVDDELEPKLHLVNMSVADEVAEEYYHAKLVVGEKSNDYAAYKAIVPRLADVPSKDVQQKARHQLAAAAIKDIFGIEDDEDQLNDILFFSDGETDAMDDGTTGGPVEAKVVDYVYGLLWNLKKYRTGVCGDIGFQYGKRLAPSSRDIKELIKNAADIESPTPSQTSPITPGMSCLAALPLGVRYLLPEPYASLSNETIEEMYNICADPLDSSFDVGKFQSLCISTVGIEPALPAFSESERLAPSSRGWTVVSKEARISPIRWKPPKFSKDFNELYPDRFIWASEWIPADKQIRSQKQLSLTRDKLPSAHGRRSANPTKGSLDRQLATSTADGCSAIYCLSHLEKLGLVEFEWAIDKNDEWSEYIRLLLRVVFQGSADKPETLTFETRRSKHGKKRKIAKQQLAAIAMQAIFQDRGGSWNEMTLQEFRESAASILSEVREEHSNMKQQKLPERAMKTIDGADAISCLKQLEDVGLLRSVNFRTDGKAETREVVSLCVRRNGAQDLFLSKKRRVQSSTRKSVRQGLAAEAMVLVAGHRWFDHSFEGLKLKLKEQSPPLIVDNTTSPGET